MGVGAVITGVVYMGIDWDIGTPLIISGAVVANGGGAIWIYQSVRCNNIHRTMEQITRKTSLSFGATNNGVGLVLRF